MRRTKSERERVLKAIKAAELRTENIYRRIFWQNLKELPAPVLLAHHIDLKWLRGVLAERDQVLLSPYLVEVRDELLRREQTKQSA